MCLPGSGLLAPSIRASKRRESVSSWRLGHRTPLRSIPTRPFIFTCCDRWAFRSPTLQPMALRAPERLGNAPCIEWVHRTMQTHVRHCSASVTSHGNAPWHVYESCSMQLSRIMHSTVETSNPCAHPISHSFFEPPIEASTGKNVRPDI